MARIDYYAIEEAIKTVLENDANVPSGATIEIESERMFSPEQTPWVGIYLFRSQAPEEMQSLSAGTRLHKEIRFMVVCAEYHLESIQKAAEARDDLLGKVELALMADRDLNNTVDASWIESVEFDNAETGKTGFLSAARIELVARATATT